MTEEQMIGELVQFYEAAGFSDYYERELKGRTDAETRKIYEEWRRTYVDEDE